MYYKGQHYFTKTMKLQLIKNREKANACTKQSFFTLTESRNNVQNYFILFGSFHLDNSSLWRQTTLLPHSRIQTLCLKQKVLTIKRNVTDSTKIENSSKEDPRQLKNGQWIYSNIYISVCKNCMTILLVEVKIEVMGSLNFEITQA